MFSYLQDPSSYCMDGQAVSDLVYGLELGQELKLPVYSCFRVEQMSQLLASVEIVRPFCQLRLVVRMTSR